MAEDEDLVGTTRHNGTTGLLKILREVQSQRLETVTGSTAPLAAGTTWGIVTVINAPTYKNERASSPRAYLDFSLSSMDSSASSFVDLSPANQIPQDLVDLERSPRSTILPK
jgi:hypothetical protein